MTRYITQDTRTKIIIYIHMKDVNYVCAKAGANKRSKSQFSRGTCPSLPHALYTDMYLPPQ